MPHKSPFSTRTFTSGRLSSRFSSTFREARLRSAGKQSITKGAAASATPGAEDGGKLHLDDGVFDLELELDEEASHASNESVADEEERGAASQWDDDDEDDNDENDSSLFSLNLDDSTLTTSEEKETTKRRSSYGGRPFTTKGAVSKTAGILKNKKHLEALSERWEHLYALKLTSCFKVEEADSSLHFSLQQRRANSQ